MAKISSSWLTSLLSASPHGIQLTGSSAPPRHPQYDTQIRKAARHRQNKNAPFPVAPGPAVYVSARQSCCRACSFASKVCRVSSQCLGTPNLESRGRIGATTFLGTSKPRTAPRSPPPKQRQSHWRLAPTLVRVSLQEHQTATQDRNLNSKLNSNWGLALFPAFGFPYASMCREPRCAGSS